MVSARDQLRRGCGIEGRPRRDAPIRLGPAAPAVALPVPGRPLCPGFLEPGGRVRQFRLPPGLRPSRDGRVLRLGPAIETGADIPPPQPQPLPHWCLWRAYGDRVVGRGEHVPARRRQMRREGREDIRTRSQRARRHPVGDDALRPIARCLHRREPGACPLGQELRFPVRSDHAAPPTRILGIGPAEGHIQQIAEGPPVVRGGAHRGWRVRIVAEHPRPDMDRAG